MFTTGRVKTVSFVLISTALTLPSGAKLKGGGGVWGGGASFAPVYRPDRGSSSLRQQ